MKELSGVLNAAAYPQKSEDIFLDDRMTGFEFLGESTRFRAAVREQTDDTYVFHDRTYRVRQIVGQMSVDDHRVTGVGRIGLAANRHGSDLLVVFSSGEAILIEGIKTMTYYGLDKTASTPVASGQ